MCCKFLYERQQRAKVRGGTFHLLAELDTPPHHLYLRSLLEWNFTHLQWIHASKCCSGETNRKGDAVSTNEPLGCRKVPPVRPFEIRPSRASGLSSKDLNQQISRSTRHLFYCQFIFWPNLTQTCFQSFSTSGYLVPFSQTDDKDWRGFCCPQRTATVTSETESGATSGGRSPNSKSLYWPKNELKITWHTRKKSYKKH